MRGLQCGSKYIIRAKGINFLNQETPWSDPFEIYTTPCSSVKAEPALAAIFDFSLDFSLGENYEDAGLYYDNQGGYLSVAAVEQLGKAENSDFLENVFIENIHSASPVTPWQTKAVLPQPITAAASGVIGQYIYIAGGTYDWNNSAYLRRYDTLNNSWENKKSLPALTVSPLAAVLNDKLYIIGGKDKQALALGMVYDPAGDSWSNIAEMSRGRIGAVGGAHDNKIYVTGGVDGQCGSNIQTTEVYDPATNTWQAGLAPFPLVKSGGATARFIGGKLYVAGGQFDCGNQFSDSIVAYDPETDTWETNLAPMPAKRSGGASAVVDGMFLYIGGTDENWDSSNEIYLYNPATDSWHQIFDLPDFLHRSSVNLVDDRLFVMGGRNYGWDSVDTNFSVPVSNFRDKSLNKIFKSITWSPATPGFSSINLSYSADGGKTYNSLGEKGGTFDLDGVSSYSLKLKFEAVSDGDNHPNVQSYSVNYITQNTAIYNSKIFDGSKAVNWNYLFFDAEIPTGASISFQTRTGDSDIFNNTWSDWATSTDGSILSPPARYLQVRAMLTPGVDAPLLRSFGLMFAPLGEIPASPITNISPSSPQALLLQGESLPDVNIYILAETPNPSLNASHLRQVNENLSSVFIFQNIDIFSNISGRQLRLHLPKGVKITAPSVDWSGVISLPQPGSGADLEFGEGLEVVSSFKVGNEDIPLAFDRAVRILIPDLAGRRIGYYDQLGSFHEIDVACSADTQEAGNSLPENGDCKINIAGDLVIYTKHFTQFIVFQAAGLNDGEYGLPKESREAFSTPPAPACEEVIYSDWIPCQTGFNLQFRTIVFKYPEDCSLTIEQRKGLERICSPLPSATEENISTEVQNNTFLKDVVLLRERALLEKINAVLTKRLLGRILLQIEEKGEAWYLNPLDGRRYYLGRPADALNLMRALGLGASNQDIASFLKTGAPARLKGRILLQVKDKGQAYYVNPITLKLHYLGRPADAHNLMRTLGLGISNSNIQQIEVEK